MAGNGWFRPMHGFHPHRPAFRHRAAATLLGGAMWFWILVRAKEDGPVLLVRTFCQGITSCLHFRPCDNVAVVLFFVSLQGWRHPWDHHGAAH